MYNKNRIGRRGNEVHLTVKAFAFELAVEGSPGNFIDTRSVGAFGDRMHDAGDVSWLHVMC